MTENDKRHAIEEFFVAPKPEFSWKAIIAGGFVAFIGLMTLLQGGFLAGLILLAIGAGVVAFLPLSPTDVPGVKQGTEPTQRFSLSAFGAAKQRFEKRVAAAQIQTWLDEDIVRLEESSRVAIGLLKPDDGGDDSGVLSGVGARVREARNAGGGANALGADDKSTRQRDTMTVVGTVNPSEVVGFDPAVVRCRRIGDSNAYLYSTWRVVIVHFTDYFLGVHQTTYNMIKNAAVMDEINECFYRDVVQINNTTISSNVTLDHGKTFVHVKVFKLSMSSGENIQLQLSQPEIELAADLNSKNDATIQKIRATLRGYKQDDLMGRPGQRAGVAAT
jgi:hypothetical protein